MADERNFISKIQIPSGSTYYFEDAKARELIAALEGVEFVIAWNGQTEPDVTKIPAGVKVTYESVEYTGTLAASENTKAKIYFVAKAQSSTTTYAEYVTVNTGTKETPVYAWEKIGDTDISGLGALAWKNSASGSYTDKWVNEAKVSVPTTLSFAGDEKTISSNGSVVVKEYASSDKYLTATGSGVAVAGNGSALAVTGYSAPESDTFVKSYAGSTSKLVKTTVMSAGEAVSIPNVDSVTSVEVSKVTVSSTATASKATAGTAVTVAKAGTAVDVYGINTNDSSKTLLDSATIGGTNNDTLILGTISVAKQTITPAVNNGSITPYSFTDVDVKQFTVTNNNASLVTLGTAIQAAGTGTSVSVATGALSADGEGADVMIGLGTPTTASAMIGLGSPTTSTVLTGVKVTAQPTITLTSATSSSTGSIKYAEGISSSDSTKDISVSGKVTPTGDVSITASEDKSATLTYTTDTKTVTVA